MLSQRHLNLSTSATTSATLFPHHRIVDALRNVGDVNIKNPANTHVVKFGGKLLALFEAGAPYELDPVTLKTIGPFGMSGNVPVEGGERLAVAVDGLPEAAFLPKMNGRAHTAHPRGTHEMAGWWGGHGLRTQSQDNFWSA